MVEQEKTYMKRNSYVFFSPSNCTTTFYPISSTTFGPTVSMFYFHFSTNLHAQKSCFSLSQLKPSPPYLNHRFSFLLLLLLYILSTILCFRRFLAFLRIRSDSDTFLRAVLKNQIQDYAFTVVFGLLQLRRQITFNYCDQVLLELPLKFEIFKPLHYIYIYFFKDLRIKSISYSQDAKISKKSLVGIDLWLLVLVLYLGVFS